MIFTWLVANVVGSDPKTNGNGFFLLVYHLLPPTTVTGRLIPFILTAATR